MWKRPPPVNLMIAKPTSRSCRFSEISEAKLNFSIETPEIRSASLQSENSPNKNRKSGLETGWSMEDLEMELNRIRRTLRLTAERQLQTLAGKSLADLSQNRSWVSDIHQMLDGHGLRVICSECGQPAILRVSPRSGMATGAFVFDHTIDGRRTFHGGSSHLPLIRLTSKPQRKRPSAAG